MPGNVLRILVRVELYAHASVYVRRAYTSNLATDPRLAANGEGEGAPRSTPIKRHGRTIFSAPAARNHQPFTDPSNDC